MPGLVMLSKALQRNAKHEASLSKISDVHLRVAGKTNQRWKAWPRGLRPLRCSLASLRMTIRFPLQRFNASTL
jgi:hypothetical protein